jgi:hypothetical protein
MLADAEQSGHWVLRTTGQSVRNKPVTSLA